MSKSRLASVSLVACWLVAVACSSSSSDDATSSSSCAALTACCASLPSSQEVLCEAIGSGSVAAACSSQLVAFQTSGFCGSAASACAALTTCCDAMGAGATKTACTTVAAAGSSDACDAELVAYEGEHACGVGSGSSSGSRAASSGHGGSSARSATSSLSSTSFTSTASGSSATTASSSSGVILHDAGFNDAVVPVDAPACIPDAGPAGPGPLTHTCIIYPAGADDENECDGHHDPPSPFPANGTTGNGFDDNCNGLVDEGCSCGRVGVTKPCYLVPATQTENGLPVGWCATNSVGTVNCAQQGEAAPTWSGQCRGAQLPYANDVCAPGDFDCDGKPENPSGESCACVSSAIVCPTAALTTVPYPDPSALPLEVNAASWFTNPGAVADASDWTWTLTGGDCDNILPNPTFGLYATPVATDSPVGTTATTLGTSGKEHGTIAKAPAVTSVVYPAFSLSGDYVLTASWVLGGQAYSCGVQIAVRAPGLRAEGCWDTEAQGDDLDLHMAKIDGFTQCATSHAWSDLDCATANEDCYYDDCYAGGGVFGITPTVDWGFAAGPAADCTGWGSQSSGTTCSNPRLDRDANGLSGICDPTVVNPDGMSATGGFCGPENINLDAPASGDQYAIGMRFYTQNGTTNPHMHVDVYCDGQRIFAGGYDPVTGSEYPQAATAGADSAGDMWKVGIVTTTVSGTGALSCAMSSTSSTIPDVPLDGTSAYCVDDATLNGAASQEYLTAGGGVPATANALCFH